MQTEINGADPAQLRTLEGTGLTGDGWVGRAAVVTLANPQRQPGLSLAGVNVQIEFRLTPSKVFVPAQLGTSQDDRALSFRLAKIALVDPASGYFRVTLPLPEALLAASRIVVTINPGGTWVPAERGMNADTRRLSYRLDFIGLK